MMKVNNILKQSTEWTLKRKVNSACFTWFHQPKLPKGIEKFKK